MFCKTYLRRTQAPRQGQAEESRNSRSRLHQIIKESFFWPLEVIFKGDLLVMKIKITYLILSPLVICYFKLILIFDLDHFLGDLPYLCLEATPASVYVVSVPVAVVKEPRKS